MLRLGGVGGVCEGRGISQQFLLLTAPDNQLAALSSRLQALGFDVTPSGRMVAGVHVRVHQDNADDEADVQAFVDAVAPDARRGPSGSPTRHVVGYRE